MASKTFPVGQAIPEQSSYGYSVHLRQADGSSVDVSQIDEIYVTLRDLRSMGIVNGRNQLPSKNNNGGELTAGLFAVNFNPEDMPAIGPERFQPRLLTLDIHLSGGGRSTRDVLFWVRALEDIPD